MPIQIDDGSSSSAASELTKAGIAGAWLAVSTETGGRAIGHAAESLFLRGIPRAAKFIGKTAYRTGKFGVNTAARAKSLYGFNGGFVRDMVGGAAKGTTTALSWMYRHPIASIGVAGGAGALIASTQYSSANERSASPGMTEAMGGVSTQGTQRLMELINANGNIVLGLHNRR